MSEKLHVRDRRVSTKIGSLFINAVAFVLPYFEMSFILRSSLRPSPVLLSSLVLLGLGGCVASDNPTLSPEARQSLKLTGVTVDYTPDASIHISAVEDEVNSRGVAPREQVAQAEQAQISRVLPEEFLAQVGPKLAGSHAVIARVHIKYFNIPGPLATVAISGNLGLAAGVDLVDATSGEILNSIPPGKISSGVFRPSGIIGFAVQAAEARDPSEKKTRELSRAFGAEYAAWIAPK